MTDEVLDFVGKRKENIEKKRRGFERVLFQNFLGAYTVIDNAGSVYPIELVDISHEGCLFRIPWNMKKDQKLEEGSEINLRMYFTKDSYLPVIVNIKYGSENIENGQTYMQYGCEFDQSLPTFSAMQDFIKFMYSFAEYSAIDKGDARAFFL